MFNPFSTYVIPPGVPLPATLRARKRDGGGHIIETAVMTDSSGYKFKNGFTINEGESLTQDRLDDEMAIIAKEAN